MPVRARLEIAAPVAEARSIKEISETLVGAAKESWLRKWSKWMREIAESYGVEDPEVVFGIRDLDDPRQVEGFLLEHFQDLTEDEALRKIREMLRERGYTENVTEEMIESMIDYWESVKDRPEIHYALPYEIQSEVEELREHPELDSGRAFKVVYDFLISEGASEEEARKVAEDIARSIPAIPKEARQVLWTQLFHVAKATKQRTLDEFMAMDKRAEKVEEEARRDIGKTAWLLEWQRKVFNQAASQILREFGRLPEEWRDTLKQFIAEEATIIDKTGVSKEWAFKTIDDAARRAVEYTLKAVTPYEKAYEAVKEALGRPREVRAPPRPPEIPAGPSIVPVDTLKGRGVRFIPANLTKTVEETLKRIEEWAKANRLRLQRVNYVEFPRARPRELWVVYYPDRPVTKAYVEGDSTIKIVNFDAPAVAYRVSYGTVYVAVYRGVGG